MFLIAQANLLNFFIRTLEARNAFVIYPYSNWWFSSLLDCHDPIIVRVHCNDIVCMTLHKDLFSSVHIFSDEDTTCWIVNFIIFEDQIGIVKWAEGKCRFELKKRVWRKDSNHSIWFVNRRYILSYSFFACSYLFSFNNRKWKLFRRLYLLFL